MNHQPQRQTAPVVGQPVASSLAEARKLAENVMAVMTQLLALIERETELVRAGQVREAITLEPTKSDMSRRYVAMIALLKGSQSDMAQAAPDLVSALRQHHDVFRSMLQVNLTVLATAHAVSEGIVRGVNAEMQRRNIPQTYTAAGHRAQPGPRNMTPIAINRSL